MGSPVIIILLIIIVALLALGFYLIKSNAPSGGDDEGVRVIGSAHSIVSVRKLSDGGSMYEVKVEDLPVIDMYDEGEFLHHEESPLERWLRDDISMEERRLLAEELKTRYGIDMGWTDPANTDNDTSDSEPVLEDEEVDPETLMPIAPAKSNINQFASYNPFEGENEGSVREAVEVLMRFIIENYRKGLLKPEVVVHASERYEQEMDVVAQDMSVDIERLRREQNLSGIRIDSSIVNMPFEAFDMYVHDTVASAAVSEVLSEEVADEDIAEQVEEIDDSPELVAEGRKDDDAPADTDAVGYDWGDLGDN